MKKVYVLFLASILSFMFGVETIGQVNVTFRVDMQEVTVSPLGVHIAGNFSLPLPSWDPSGIELDSPLIGSVYSVTLELPLNSNFEFKYVNGDTWGQDESVPGQCAQNNNRYVEIGENDTTLSVVCYGSCLPCILPMVDITFQVDMSNQEVSTEGVHIAGSFQAWDPDSTEMTHIGNNIYQITFQLGEGEYHEYKFLNGNAWGADETVPPPCVANNNRYLTVPVTNTTLDAVCFGSCDPCSGVTDINVTFQVDMSEADSISAEGVHIAGGFQSWDPSATLMTDMGNGIYAYTVVLNSGSYQEYKFVNHNTWDGAEQVPAICATLGNRVLNVPDNDTILPAVCFSSCVICNPPMYDVTFRVDMTTQIVSPDGVHLIGSFQAWDPAVTEMLPVGNNIYEVTLMLGEGELHEYKFINGNTYDGAEFVPEECGNFDGNREVIGPPTPQILDVVCFGECAECTTILYTFNLKVMLEGPFNGTDMNTALFDNVILPIDQPFNTGPWNYDGLQTLTAPAEAEVVDWVYIQFRETDEDASTATEDKLLDHQAAIVLADGTIATPDGNPNIYFNGNIVDNLYIVIYSRNHLSVMSSIPLVEIFSAYSYDFTSDLTKAYSSDADGHKLLGGGIYGMFGGDSDGYGTVDIDDKDLNWTTDAGIGGYYNSDLNFDGQVDNTDKNTIWEPNLEISTQVPN